VAANNLQRNAHRRLYILGTLFLLWAGFVCGRLVQRQIVRYGDLQQHAIRQQQRTIEVAPKRGIIYDRQGHELAMSILVDSVFAVPIEIPDPTTAAALLGRILKSDPNELRARFQASRTFT